MKPTNKQLADKLAKARAALGAIRTISTARTPKTRLEYITSISIAALDMTK